MKKGDIKLYAEGIDYSSAIEIYYLFVIEGIGRFGLPVLDW